MSDVPSTPSLGCASNATTAVGSPVADGATDRLRSSFTATRNDALFAELGVRTHTATPIIASRLNLAVFASGTGSNFRAICEAAREGRLGLAEPVLLITNRECGALAVADEFEIPYRVVSPTQYASTCEWNEAIAGWLGAFEIDFVALAGYLKIVGSDILDAFPGRILNLHPSILPAYPGLHAIKRIWAEGACEAGGVTVHITDNSLDGGPIIAQQRVDMRAYTTESDFAQAVHAAEHALFPATIAQFSHRITRKEKTGTPLWLRRAREAAAHEAGSSEATSCAGTADHAEQGHAAADHCKSSASHHL